MEGLQGGFVISDIVLVCDDPTYKASSVWELSLLNQFSGFTTLQALVSEAMQGGLINNDLVYEEWRHHIYPSPSKS